ncbi:MAG: ASCH domain-containing protein [Deinococcaceae bacterium]
MGNPVDRFWKDFVAIQPHYAQHPQPVVGYFGDSPEMAERLGSLVLKGQKTATCTALAFYAADGEPLPTVGGLEIILDGQDKPWLIIKTTEVTVCKFIEVDARFAFDEGEGDRSLEYWRSAHWNYFARTLPTIGLEPSEGMELMCQRFVKIYPM